MKASSRIAAATLAFGLASATGALAASPADAITLSMPFGSSQVLAWSWGASSSVSFQGGGAGAGKTNFQDMAFTRNTDQQSPEFLKALARGTALERVRISRGTLRLELQGVNVTSYSVGASAADKSQQTENITLTFQRIRYDVDGATFCFDVLNNGDC